MFKMKKPDELFVTLLDSHGEKVDAPTFEWYRHPKSWGIWRATGDERWNMYVFYDRFFEFYLRPGKLRYHWFGGKYQRHPNQGDTLRMHRVPNPDCPGCKYDKV